MEKSELRPCDCKDMASAQKLECLGIGHNDQGITLNPNVVILKMGATTLDIPMDEFMRLCQQYLAKKYDNNHPHIVQIKSEHSIVRVPMKRFRMFARWYIEPQEIG